MKNKLWKKILTVGLVAAMAVTVVAGCGGKGDSGDKEKNGTVSDEGGVTDEFAGKNAEFTWWIYKTDAELGRAKWRYQRGGYGQEAGLFLSGTDCRFGK